MVCWTHDFDLESMTIEELEDICISRGFELVKEIDPDTGAPKEFSKEEYIEAAKQCLDIEAEMEDILQKHPELIEEIQAETEKMKLEQEKLENKLSDMKQLLNETTEEHELPDEYEHIFDELDQTEKDDQQLEVIDAWLRSQNLNEYGDREGSVYTGGTPLFDEQTGKTVNRLNYLLKMFPEKPWMKDEHDQDNTIESCAPSEESTTDENDNKIEAAEERNKPTEGTGVVSDKPSDVEILSLDDILDQFKTKILNDLTFVVDLVLPKQLREPLMQVMRPMVRIIRQGVLTTYDMVKRYTGLILKEINDRADENKNNESNVVAAKE